MLSIIIPTLNAAPLLGATLDSLEGGADEVVVADGGSTDGTSALAEERGARIVVSTRGRGAQLAAGARASQGEWLLFLHADTRLGPGWREAATSHMAGNGELAGVFRLRFDDPSKHARRLERIVAWRTARLALPYGDQGLLISRVLYDAVGGFKPIPLMEDVDLAHRLGGRRLVQLDAEAVTSAERYRRDGWLLRPARNLLCLGLFLLGLPPATIERVYR